MPTADHGTLGVLVWISLWLTICCCLGWLQLTTSSSLCSYQYIASSIFTSATVYSLVVLSRFAACHPSSAARSGPGLRGCGGFFVRAFRDIFWLGRHWIVIRNKLWLTILMIRSCRGIIGFCSSPFEGGAGFARLLTWLFGPSTSTTAE